jgi:hypothetical protein
MTTSAGNKAGPKRPDVFIWEGIRPAEEFMQAIFPAIEGTDTFVFVITPDSVTSGVCGEELAPAASHNKRMVPIFAREVDVKAIPEPLAKLNWEDFDVGPLRWKLEIGRALG